MGSMSWHRLYRLVSVLAVLLMVPAFAALADIRFEWRNIIQRVEILADAALAARTRAFDVVLGSR